MVATFQKVRSQNNIFGRYDLYFWHLKNSSEQPDWEILFWCIFK